MARIGPDGNQRATETGSSQDQTQSETPDSVDTAVERAAWEDAGGYAEAQRLVQEYREQGIPNQSSDASSDPTPNVNPIEDPSSLTGSGSQDTGSTSSGSSSGSGSGGSSQRSGPPEVPDPTPNVDPIDDPASLTGSEETDGTQQTVSRGYQEAVEQTPDPAPDWRGDTRGSGFEEAVEQTPDAGASQPGDTRGSGYQEAVEQTPEPAPEPSQDTGGRNKFGNPMGVSGSEQQSRPTGREVVDPSVNNPDFGEGPGVDDVASGLADFTRAAYADPQSQITDVGDDIVPQNIERQVSETGNTLSQTGSNIVGGVGEFGGATVDKWYAVVSGEKKALNVDWTETDTSGPVAQRFEKVGEGIGSLAATPADVASLAIETTEAAGAFGGEVAEGDVAGTKQTAATIGAGVGATLIGSAKSAVENPYRTAGQFGGGALLGQVASPVRLTKTRVPTRKGSGPRTVEADIETQRLTEGVPSDTARVSIQTGEKGASTVRGVRLESPPVVEAVTDRNFQGRTLVGTRDKRPTVGTPEVDIEDVDIERAGRGKSQAGEVFEPTDPFETEVFTESLTSQGGESAQRVRAIQDILSEGETVTRKAETRQPDDVSNVIADVQEISSDVDPEQVTQALAESDATIFGSGAVRAQAPDFRDPGDLDIVVPDKTQAKQRIGEALEGTDTGLDAFDIKEADDFTGLGEGEVFGFGRRSQAPIETSEGVRINPIGEELQRKAGASGFIRERGIGGEDIDVGPRPARGPDTPVRQKDVSDTAAIGEALLGEGNQAVRGFEQAFGLREGAPTTSGGLFSGVDLDRPLREFAGDTRGQMGIGQIDLDRPRDRGRTRRADSETDTQTNRAGSRTPETDTQRGPSPSPLPGETPTRGGFSPLPGGTGSGGPSPTPSPDRGDSVGGGSVTGDESQPPADGTGGGSNVPDPFNFDSVGPSGTPDRSGGASGGPSGGPGPSEGPSPGPSGGPSPSPSSGPSPSPSSGPSPSPSPTPSPFGFGGAATSRAVRPDTDDDSDDEKDPLPSVGPAGQEFQNPVASGSAFLFGTGLGGASGQQSTAENVLPGGPGTPSERILSGTVEPPELFEGAFIND